MPASFGLNNATQDMMPPLRKAISICTTSSSVNRVNASFNLFLSDGSLSCLEFYVLNTLIVNKLYQCNRLKSRWTVW